MSLCCWWQKEHLDLTVFDHEINMSFFVFGILWKYIISAYQSVTGSKALAEIINHSETSVSKQEQPVYDVSESSCSLRTERFNTLMVSVVKERKTPLGLTMFVL